MKRILLTCFALGIFFGIHAQDRQVSGKVTSTDDNSPLPGVNVVLKGTSNGAVTDANGVYRINVPSSGGTLVFSFIGMESREEVIGARSVIDAPLSNDVKQLTEVVVTAIGEKVDKDKFASSVSQVSGGNVAKSGETSMLTGLSGKAAGVLITRNGGDPGAGAYILIRGQNTINGNAQPLFIIDGIPMSNSDGGQTLNGVTLAGGGNAIVNSSRGNDINPDDIASMEVLKGASAAALWGTRAANGVIIITTKKGKDSKGKVNISFKSTVSVDQVNKIHGLQTTYGQGTRGNYIQGNRTTWGDRISTRKGGADAFVTGPGQYYSPDGNTGLFNPIPDNDLYNGYVTFPDQTKRYAIPAAGSYKADGTLLDEHGGKNSKDTYDHKQDPFQTGHFIDNNLNISGGNARTNFMISYSNLTQTGIAKSFSDYKRNSARVNVSSQFTDWFRASANIVYVNSYSTRIQGGDNLDGILLGGLRSSPDFDNSQYIGDYTDASGLTSPNRHVSFRNPLGASLNPRYSNPIWNINNNKNTSDVDRFIGNLELALDPVSWLNITGRAGIDNFVDQNNEKFPLYSASYPTGFFQKNTSSEKQFNVDLFAKASKTFSENFTGTFLLGVNYNNRIRELNHTNIINFIEPGAPDLLANALNTNLAAFNQKSQIRTFAYYAQADIQAYNMLFLTLTARQESASTYANSFIFPSAALAWQFSKLSGLQDNSVLSFGKLRASWGQVGIQPQPYLNSNNFLPTVYLDAFATGLSANSAVFGGGYTRNNIQGNPDLRPERKTEIEVGTDLRFFNNRLTLAATLYSNQTKDVILTLNLPDETGFSFKNINAAKIENKGFELELGYDLLTKGDFKWNLSGNFSINRNKVVSLAGSAAQPLPGNYGGQSLIEGQPFGVMYGTDFVHDEKGKYILDTNGFPQAGSQSEIIGDPNPKYRSGLGSTVSYKSLSLYVLFDRVYGNDYYNGTRGAMYTFGTHVDNGSTVVATTNLKDVDGNTIPAGTEFRGAIKDFGGGPVALTQSWYQGLGTSFSTASVKQFIEDATATRLREITLTYGLRSEGFRKATKLSSIDFSLTGRNLFLWTNYSGVDPDANIVGAGIARGSDWFTNPNTKSILFSIKINY